MGFRENTPVDPEKQRNLQRWQDILNAPREDDGTDKPVEARYNFREEARQHRTETHCSINEDNSGTYHPRRGLRYFAAPRVATKRRANTKDDNDGDPKRSKTLSKSLEQPCLVGGVQSKAAQMLLELRTKMSDMNGTGTNEVIHSSKSSTKKNNDASALVAFAGEPAEDFVIELQLEGPGLQGHGLQGHRSGYYTYKIANLLVNIMEDPQIYAPVVEALASELPKRISGYESGRSGDIDEQSMGSGLSQRQREETRKAQKGKSKESKINSHAQPQNNRAVIATRLPHPLNFEADWCNWCADTYSGLIGVEAISEGEFIDRGDGKGFVTKETPFTPGSDMCPNCVLPRLQILQCSKHQMEPIRNVQTQEMTDFLLTRETAHAPFQWCSICTSLSATLTCNVCKLQLCIQCGRELEKEYGGDLNNLIVGLRNTLPEDPFLLRADAVLLHQQGELARRLG